MSSTTRRPESAAPSPAPGLLAEALVIGSGGAIGTALRGGVQWLWTATTPMPHGPEGFTFLDPIGVANLLGTAALGAILGRVSGASAHPLLRPFLCVGVLGSFTTWSTLIAETTVIASAESESAALLELGGSLALGLAAFVLGERAAPRAALSPDEERAS